jgi:hypothetical protein
MAQILRTHVFKINGSNHAIVTLKGKVKRNSRHRALCGQVIGADAVRLAPHSQPGRSAPITCDKCLASHTGMFECFEKDFGFPKPNY